MMQQCPGRRWSSCKIGFAVFVEQRSGILMRELMNIARFITRTELPADNFKLVRAEGMLKP